MRRRYYLEHDEGQFELTFQNVSEGDEIVTLNAEGSRAWVGYLTSDEDMEFPFDDGWYTIVARGKYRHGGRDHEGDEQTFQEALGLDRDWEPDTEEYLDQAYQDVIMAGLKQLNPDGQVEWRWFDQGSGEGAAWVRYKRRDSGPDKAFGFYTHWSSRRAEPDTGRYKPDIWTYHLTFRERRMVIQKPEDRALELWQADLDSGKIGNKYAVLLDVYDHSGHSWSVHGGGMNDPWDTSGGAGLWIPSEDCIKQIEKEWGTPEARRREAVRMAKGACETYTDYVNGWGYGTVVEEYKRDDPDSDWEQVDAHYSGGILGHNWALEALKEAMEEYVETETA
jgi:hypothetical protein